MYCCHCVVIGGVLLPKHELIRKEKLYHCIVCESVNIDTAIVLIELIGTFTATQSM